MPTVHDYLDALNERMEFFTGLRTRVQQQLPRIDADIAHLQQLETRNRRELAAYLLADVDDDALRELEQTLRYPALLDIKRRYEAQLDEAQARIDELAGHPRLQHVDLERRDLADQLAELMPAYEPMKKAHEAWLGSMYFYELRDRGWFDPRYEPEGFFTRFRDWRAVSLLMEDLDEVLAVIGREAPFDDDDDVRAAWNTHEEAWRPVEAAVTDIRDKQTSLEALVQRWSDAQARPRQLFDEMIQALGEAVLDHLESCPETVRFQLARHDEHLTVFMKKAAGLAKQISYLQQLRVTRLQNWLDRSNQEVNKIGRKISKIHRKLGRGKYVPVTDADVRGARRTKADKWDKRLGRFDTTRERVASFTSYQKGSFAEDYLWWDLMSGRAKGDDLYEVSAFRRAYPDWDHRHYQAPWETGDDADDDHDLVDSALDTAADALAAQAMFGDRDDDDASLLDVS